MISRSIALTLSRAPIPILHLALLGWYVLIWVVMAISPYDRSDWLLENFLSLLFLGVLIGTYNRFQFSNVSYVLITVFMTLHTLGAHYTYSEVPFGFWLKEAFGLSRNHYDRIVHFAFGLLMAYPFREVLMRKGGLRDPWSYVVAVAMVQAGSDLFEIIESWVALIVNPDLGNAYLGTQGDEWDAQKDMTCALVGGILSMAITAVLVKLRHIPSIPSGRPREEVRMRR
jgi:putative membrane protein